MSMLAPLLAGTLLGKAATIYDGKEAVFTQAYGPEARGGASRADIIIAAASRGTSPEPFDMEYRHPHGGDRMVEPVHQRRTVVQPGQRVGNRTPALVLQLLLEFLDLTHENPATAKGRTAPCSLEVVGRPEQLCHHPQASMLGTLLVRTNLDGDARAVDVGMAPALQGFGLDDPDLLILEG